MSSKVEKLKIGDLGPRMRGAKVLRNIKVVGKDGSVVRVINSAQLHEGLVARAGVEYDVESAVQPIIRQCRCGDWFMGAPKRIICDECRNPKCTVCDKKVSILTRRRALANGSRDYTCIACRDYHSPSPLKGKCFVCGAPCHSAGSRRVYCDEHKPGRPGKLSLPRGRRVGSKRWLKEQRAEQLKNRRFFEILPMSDRTGWEIREYAGSFDSTHTVRADLSSCQNRDAVLCMLRQMYPGCVVRKKSA